MEVLLVNTGVLPIPPETSAGAEYHIYHLANHIAKYGIRVHLISDIKRGFFFHPNIKIYNYHLHYHPPINDFSGWLQSHIIGGVNSSIKYLEILPKISPDLIHIHGRLAARVISMLNTNKPLIYTLHDQSPFSGAFKGLQRFIRVIAYLTMEYKIIYNVDHIIAVSRQIYNELVDWARIPNEKVSYVPNGVDTNYFKPSKDKKPFILFVGRLTKRKGADILIKAFARVSNKLTEYKLIIVGDGEEKTKLKNLVKKLNIENYVSFMSNIPMSLLREIYAKASIFVLPSRGEGFPLSLLEAMSSGCAVIATKISGVVDVIDNGKNGLLVKPGDERDLSQTLEFLLSDGSLIKKLANNARKLVERKYNWDIIAKKTIKIYKNIKIKFL